MDSIRGEILKALSEKTKSTLYKLVNQVNITGEIPKDFEQTLLVLITPQKIMHRDVGL